jgi:hypothetical protein
MFTVPRLDRWRRVALAACCAFAAGCESDTVSSSPPAVSAVHPMGTPATPSANVSRLQAWRDAELIASLAPGRLEVVGSGESMRPVYGDATILVISRTPYEDLRPGMTVAYTTERGTRVVHQLVSQDKKGWRLQGLNNPAMDRERVTRENLIGVVYASLAYDPALK